MRRFLKFSFRFASADGWYGIVPPSTMLNPAGTPSLAECASIFQCAVPSACQIPFRSGLRSGVRGPLYTDVAEIARQHDATVKMLRDWIAVPSIAAEDRNYPQGADYMARLARDAGFTRVDIVPTKGKPGVFAMLDARAATTLALYFMYDVK